jgi:radical SAM superfamily enzyme YgiQ (UPF0313 family)
MRDPGAIILISCYELGHQPLNLASPFALLQQAGFAPIAVDTSVETLRGDVIKPARLVAISVPMHTALRLSIPIAERVRRLNPDAHICFYGLYASLNGDYLLQHYADSIIGGEFEEALVSLADALLSSVDNHPQLSLPGVRTRDMAATPVLKRLTFAQPAREALPENKHYAHLVHEGRVAQAGYVEASRGCLHTCRHCPITPVYGGRFFVVPREIVLQDIRAQVRDGGARHITFGDPDFLNGPRHSLAIVEALHQEFPEVTFDATIKVEHIVEHRDIFPRLAELGCLFVVSAVESLSEGVLGKLKKGHSRADVALALAILDDAGVPMRPTFVAFTPWTTAEDYLELLAFVSEHDLVEHIDPVQYSIRLLIPPGSALLEDIQNSSAGSAEWLSDVDEAAFTYRWRHPDARMDGLQVEIAALVETAVREHWSNSLTFEEICALAEAYLGEAVPLLVSQAVPASPGGIKKARHPVPHLSEPWFC